MALSANRYVWRFLFAISVFFTGFFAVLFYFQDIFIVLILGAILLLICEKVLFCFDRVMDNFPNLNRKAIGLILVLFSMFSVLSLISSQMDEIAILLTEAAKVQQDFTGGYSALFGSESQFTRLANSGFVEAGDLQAIGNAIFTELTGTVSKISYYFFTGALIIPLMFSMYFRHRNKLGSYIGEYAPQSHAEIIHRALKDMGRELEDFFSAKMLESAVVGLICCIGFYFAGVDSWFLLGVLAGFLNIIPYIGPIIGAIPPIIVGYFTSPETALMAAGTVLAAQLVDNFYLIPFMISEKVNINPLLSVVLTLAASKLFGPLGMVLAIPIFIVYKIVITESYKALVKIYPDED